MSLKTEIEQTISDAIDIIAGRTSPEVDPLLAIEDRIGNNEISALPTDADYTQGPLVRVMITDHATLGEEFGDESNRVSRMCTSPSESGQISSDTEEIIRLHLQHLTFDIETAYENGSNSYATELRYQGSSFDTSTVSGRQTAPQVEVPVPVVGNSGAGTLRVDADQAFSGRQNETITVQVVTPNATPDSVTGLSVRYKVGNGAWSSAIPLGKNPTPIVYNVHVQMAISGTVAAGDSWTIQARTSELYSIGLWVQSWVMSAEATAIF
jgi:hypothetical protein